MRCVPAVRITILLCLFSFISSAASAFTVAVRPGALPLPESKEFHLVVPYGKNSITGELEIRNESGRIYPLRLESSRPALKEDMKKRGALRFIHNKKAEDSVSIMLPRQGTVQIPIRADGIDWFGEFQGAITLTSGNNMHTSILVILLKPEMQPIEVTEAKDGRIKLSVDKPGRKDFSITVKNPAGLFRSLDISLSITDGNGQNVAATVKESPLHIESGSQKLVHLRLRDELPKGTYEGLLTLSDAYTYQQYPLSLDSPYLTSVFPDQATLGIFLLVFFGALTSLMLTKSAPVSSRKKELRKRILEMDNTVKSLTIFEPSLYAKFVVELIRIKTINENTKIYTPSADERLKNVSSSLDKLEKLMVVRKEISDLYVDIDKGDIIPFSIEEEVRGRLKEADLNLYLDRLEAAKKIVVEAAQRFRFDRKEFCRILLAKIEAFLKKKGHPGEPYGESLLALLKDQVYPEIKSYIAKEQAAKNEEPGCPEELREWDLVWGKVDLYFNRFSKQLPSQLRKEYHETVVQLLKSNRHDSLLAAGALCESLAAGITTGMIEDAVRQGKCRIEHQPLDPTVDRVVEFKFIFEEKEMSDSSLKARFRFIWDFGDGTSRAEGPEVIHYFKRRGPLVLIRKWFRRNFMIPFSSSKALWKQFPVSIEISISGEHVRFPETPFIISVYEPAEKQYESGLTFLSLLSFIATLFISCIIAVVGSFDEGFSFKSLKDILAPFLIGFSLDISREKLFAAGKEKVQNGKPDASS